MDQEFEKRLLHQQNNICSPSLKSVSHMIANNYFYLVLDLQFIVFGIYK